jgi:cytochrome c biogenesis protein CcdA
VTAIFLGMLLGMRHALDADHVAAITTIVSGERSVARAMRIGAWWGIGHSATILVVGGAIVLFRLSVPPRVALALEFVVALMLIGLGVLNLWPRKNHAPPATPRSSVLAPRSSRLGLPPAVIGIIHGLAGSAAIALLALAAVPDPVDGVLYLFVFAVGTIAGMMVVTTAIAAPTMVATRRISGFPRYARLGAGALSLALGLVLAHEIGIGHDLFGASPEWTAR